MSEPAKTLKDLIKQLFPLPDHQTLLKETTENCPFVNLGMRGGYGQTRHELVCAIQLADWEYAEQLYHSLVKEGLLDEQADLLVDGKPTEIEFLAHRLAGFLSEVPA